MRLSFAQLIALLATLACTSTTLAQEIEGWGRFTGNFRGRIEEADQEGRRSSTAVTLRSRVGFESVDLNGLTLFVEGSDIQALEEEDYLGFPGPGRTVIADPEGTHLNRATLTLKQERFTGILGRQRIILDGARFVGNVGWRQREQTFDALSIKYDEGAFSGYYGFINKVHRIFGPDAPTGALRTFDSDSHLFNGAYQLDNGVKVGGYAYLLDFSNARANSTDTVGLYLSGTSKIENEISLNYYLEYANQESGSSSPLEYSADYFHLNLVGALSGWKLGAGYEVLGSDNGVGFKTPLATLHKFNGWADAFLATPGSGLQDLYLSLGTTVESVGLLLVYHDFNTETGSSYLGGEVNFQATWKVNDQVLCIAKFADLQGRNGIPDNQKIWLETNLSF